MLKLHIKWIEGRRLEQQGRWFELNLVSVTGFVVAIHCILPDRTKRLKHYISNHSLTKEIWHSQELEAQPRYQGSPLSYERERE